MPKIQNPSINNNNNIGMLPHTLLYKELSLSWLCDVFFSLFVVCPLVVANWSYIWQIYDEVTGKTLRSGYITAVVGCGAMVLMCVAQEWLKTTAVTKRNYANSVALKSYTVISALFSILSWRGVWTLMDIYWAPDEDDAASFATISAIGYSLLFGTFLLVSTGTMKTSCVSPPFYLFSDDTARINADIFDFPTRFNCKCSTHSCGPVLLDAVFSVVIPTVGVVGLWRSIWLLQDTYLVVAGSPQTLESALVSCVAGWFLGFALILLSSPVGACLTKIEKGMNWWARFSLENLWSLLLTIAVVLLWRGIWNAALIYEQKIFGDDNLLAGAFCMASITMLILVVLSVNGVNSAKGVAMDGYTVELEIQYFNSTKKVGSERTVVEGITQTPQIIVNP